MNVYDFDNTIFNGDTEDRFFDYIFERRKDLFSCIIVHNISFLSEIFVLVLSVYHIKVWFVKKNEVN